MILAGEGTRLTRGTVKSGMCSTFRFDGRDAIAAGLVTPGQLRGSQFRRLFSGIFVGAARRRGLRNALPCRHADGRRAWECSAAGRRQNCSERPAGRQARRSSWSCPGARHRRVPDWLCGPTGWWMTRSPGCAASPSTTALRTAFDLGAPSASLEAICARRRDHPPMRGSQRTRSRTSPNGHGGCAGIASSCRRFCADRAPWPTRRWSRGSGSRSRMGGFRDPVLQHRVGPIRAGSRLSRVAPRARVRRGAPPDP